LKSFEAGGVGRGKTVEWKLRYIAYIDGTVTVNPPVQLLSTNKKHKKIEPPQKLFYFYQTPSIARFY
jgi:hypothetical protein